MVVQNSWQLFPVVDWDANQYYRDCFTRGSANICLNMKMTVQNLLQNACVQTRVNYQSDIQKKLEHDYLLKR